MNHLRGQNARLMSVGGMCILVYVSVSREGSLLPALRMVKNLTIFRNCSVWLRACRDRESEKANRPRVAAMPRIEAATSSGVSGKSAVLPWREEKTGGQRVCCCDVAVETFLRTTCTASHRPRWKNVSAASTRRRALATRHWRLVRISAVKHRPKASF